MNDNEYLGALVMAALGHRKAVSIQECISNPIYEVQAYNACVGMVCWESEFHYAPNPIMCLESALTALGIALPERKTWLPFDGANPPETGRDCWVTISSPWGKKVYKMFWQDNNWYGVTTINATDMAAEYGVEAWYYAEERPAPYQEATP